ncbi:TPA: hypothetical protein ACHICU_004196 [Escherichia coli]|uniref:hypothetical protein n=1 Tax=Escherichia coli TaxID=562 RepID=UPI000B7FF944|nr:hypothetical protein [Escherichia coli]EEZ9789994.1 hypothetical protein [Escherichia coli O91]EES5189798.1 hypothetical protein [Escherichia coli]EES9562693.1 hypothetical protein [Escherichia coli]EEU1621173.1 hypothetical protein [Escherichia coli]EEV9791464.1 hypothetical protein [Escherichia coli]
MSRYRKNKVVASGLAESWMLTAKKVTERVFGEGYAKAHPELITAFMATAAANFATLNGREAAEAAELVSINVKCDNGTLTDERG